MNNYHLSIILTYSLEYQFKFKKHVYLSVANHSVPTQCDWLGCRPSGQKQRGPDGLGRHSCAHFTEPHRLSLSEIQNKCNHQQYNQIYNTSNSQSMTKGTKMFSTKSTETHISLKIKKTLSAACYFTSKSDICLHFQRVLKLESHYGYDM